MFTELRSYVLARVQEVDSTLVAWERDVFGNNDLNKPQADKYYNLFFGPITCSREGNSFTEEFDMTLDIYVSTKRDILDQFDLTYDKAIDIKNHIIERKNLELMKALSPITDITANTITPTEMESNDKTLQFRTEFTVRRDFCLK